MNDKIICATSAKLQNQLTACGLKASTMILCIKAYNVYQHDGKLQESSTGLSACKT